VRSTRENRRFSKWKKVMDDFFHGLLDTSETKMAGRDDLLAEEWPHSSGPGSRVKVLLWP